MSGLPAALSGATLVAGADDAFFARVQTLALEAQVSVLAEVRGAPLLHESSRRALPLSVRLPAYLSVWKQIAPLDACPG